MSSIKPVFDYLDSNFLRLQLLSTQEKADRLAGILNEYWEAIRRLNPGVFRRPGDYVIQKTPGAFALHRLCARLLPAMHNARRPWDAANFQTMLEPCIELSDVDYWDSVSGVAARYGSMKGFVELAELLEESRISGV